MYKLFILEQYKLTLFMYIKPSELITQLQSYYDE